MIVRPTWNNWIGKRTNSWPLGLQGTQLHQQQQQQATIFVTNHQTRLLLQVRFANPTTEWIDYSRPSKSKTMTLTFMREWLGIQQQQQLQQQRQQQPQQLQQLQQQKQESKKVQQSPPGSKTKKINCLFEKLEFILDGWVLRTSRVSCSRRRRHQRQRRRQRRRRQWR